MRTFADRTRLTTTGVSLDAVLEHTVVITATAAQARKVRTLGYRLTVVEDERAQNRRNAQNPQGTPSPSRTSRARTPATTTTRR